MKKQRMTISELRDLKPSLDNPIELVCDDGSYYEKTIYKKVIIIGFTKTGLLNILNTDNVAECISYPEIFLESYPSQKPEPRFERITVWQSFLGDKFDTYFLDEGNRAINFHDKSRHSLKLVNVKKK